MTGQNDKVIQYVEIAGERYVVNGNNRLQVARRLGITGELQLEKVALPFRGFKTVEDVIDSFAVTMGGGGGL